METEAEPRKTIVETFMSLFKGLEHAYAVQKPDGAYMPVDSHPLSEKDVIAHLNGEQTVGLYVLTVRNNVWFMVADVDIDKAIPATPRVWALAREDARLQHLKYRSLGIPAYIEFSGGRGYHVWIFLEEAIPGKYAVLFGEKTTLKANDLLLQERHRTDPETGEGGKVHEFFPKQEEREIYGNLIKLPLGIHQVQNRIYMQRNHGEDLMESIGDGSNYGFCPFIDPVTFKPYRNQIEVLQNIERVPKSKIEEVLGVEIPDGEELDDDALNDLVNESRRCVRKGRRGKYYDVYPVKADDPALEFIERYVVNNPDPAVTPPCVREAYKRCVTLPGQFKERIAIVRYLSHKGFTPDQVAGFIKHHINDTEDNRHPERLILYTSYFYGPLNRPSPMYLCRYIKRELGLCANFGFRKPSARLMDEMEQIEERFADIRNMVNRAQGIYGDQWDEQLSVDDIILDGEQVNAIKDGINEVMDDLGGFSDDYKVVCSRFVSPLSPNGMGRLTEVLLGDGGKKKDHPPVEAVTGESGDLRPFDRYAEIRDGVRRMYRNSESKSTGRIDEARKGSRIGATTTGMLVAREMGKPCLVIVPYNTIGSDTFKVAVQISENEHERPMFGAQLGANIKMCLLWYKKVVELEQNLGKGNVAISKLPFVTKFSCVSKDSDGNTKYCPHWKDIQLGYSRDLGGALSPLLESTISNVSLIEYCAYRGNEAPENHSCAYKSDFRLDGEKVPDRCDFCRYFRKGVEERGGLVKDTCAFATIYRHLTRDEYGDRNEEVYLTNEEIDELRSLGYTVGVRAGDEDSYRKRVLVALKPYDVLLMTYQKLNALFKAREVRENEHSGEAIVNTRKLINVMQHEFDVFIFDEVSKLVGQAPHSFTAFREVYKRSDAGTINENDSYVETDIKDEIRHDLRTINSKECQIKFPDKVKENFRVLFDIYDETIGNMQHWLGPRLGDADTSSLINGEPPETVLRFVRTLHSEGKLYGNDGNNNTMPNVRYVDGIRARDIAKKLATEFSNVRSERMRERSPERIAELNREIDVIVNKYRKIIAYLHIRDNEIVVTNLYVPPFDDGVIERGYDGQQRRIWFPLGYEQGKFVAFQYLRVENPVRHHFSRRGNFEKGESEHTSMQRSFFEMYSFLERYATRANEVLKGLLYLLQVANEDSFFLDSTTTTGVKRAVTVHMEPNFVKVTGFARDTIEKTPSKVAVATDATMPLISMVDAFGMHSRVWKFGDPQHTCEKQLVIPYDRTVSTSDIISIGNREFRDKNNKFPGAAIGDYIETNEFEQRRVEKYIATRVALDGKVVFSKISSIANMFKVVWFLNAACEMTQEHFGQSDEPGARQVFVIFPNKELYRMVRGFNKNGGLVLLPSIVLYLSKYQKALWADCVRRGWVFKNDKIQYRDIPSLRVHPRAPHYEQGVWVLKVPRDGVDIDAHWFRGDRTVGTPSAHRVMVTIGDPSSPRGALDWLACYYHSNKFLKLGESKFGLDIQELGKALRRIEVMSTYFQCISRPKDPHAEVPSVVLSWGLEAGYFEWTRCERCGINEKELYEASNNSAYDPATQAHTDGIYEFVDGIGNSKVLCHACGTALGMSVAGYAPKIRQRSCSDARGVADLMSFKVPVPKHYPSLYGIKEFTPAFDWSGYIDPNGFVGPEIEMLGHAREWLDKCQLPPVELVKVKRALVQKSIMSGERVASSLYDLRYSYGGSKVGASKLNECVKEFGVKNLWQIGMERVVSEDKLVRYRLTNTEYEKMCP